MGFKTCLVPVGCFFLIIGDPYSLSLEESDVLELSVEKYMFKRSSGQ